MKILLDVDGVLADFVTEACHYNDHDLHTDPDTGALTLMGSRGDEWPWPAGEYDIAGMMGFTACEFWHHLDYKNFWLGLRPYDHVSHLLTLLARTFGKKNICLLTTPALSEHCVPEKIQWIEKHLPDYAEQYLIGPAKEFCAHDDSLLIDDSDANVNKFRNAGGNALLFPQWWNTNWRHAHNRMRFIEATIKSWAPKGDTDAG